METINQIVSNKNLPDRFRVKIREAWYRFEKESWGKKNWNKKDSKIIEKETLLFALSLLENIFIWMQYHAKIELPTPEVLPRRNGTIGILLKDNETNLQIVVRKYEDSAYFFYYCGKSQNGFRTSQGTHLHPIDHYKQMEFIHVFQ